MSESSMTRKQFLRLATLSAGAWLTRVRPSAADEEQKRRVGLLVQEFDRRGNHRTGTRPDLVSAQWLSTELQGWKVSASLEEFALSRVDPITASLQFRERRIDGVPLYDGSFTDAAGLVGKFGLPGGSDLALVEESDPAWPEVRRAYQHAALVLVTKAERPGLALRDAPDFRAPFGPPVLQVSSDDGPFLREQAGKGVDARLVLEVRRTAVQAFNVIARVKGRDPSLPPLVVAAPRSAWWRGTSERGGALACLLEAARALPTSRPLRDCVFVSCTGQELGALGFSALSARHPELVSAARAWVSLGPHLGASEGTRVAVRASESELATAAAEALSAAGVTPPAPTGGSPAGEAGLVAASAAHWISLSGEGNPFARLQADKWPGAVDLDRLAQIAQAVVSLAVRLSA